MVIVTHELAFARDMADHVVMERGATVEEGPSETMFPVARPARNRDILRISSNVEEAGRSDRVSLSSA